MNYKNSAFVSAMGRATRVAYADFGYYTKNGFWVVVKEVFTIAVGLLSSVAFARLTSKEILGQYQLILSFFSILAITSISGFGYATTRAVARGFDGGYQRSTMIKVASSLLGSLGLLAISGYYYFFKKSGLIGASLLIAAPFFPLIYGFNLWRAFFQGKEKFKTLTEYSLIQDIVVTSLLIFILYFFPNKLAMIVLTYLILNSFFNVVFYKRSLAYVKNEKVEKGYYKYGLFLSKMSILSMLVNNIDKILIGVLDIKFLAIYTISLGLINKIKNFTKAIFSILMPKLSRKDINFSSWEFLLFLFVMGLACASVLMLFSEPILFFLYGKKYAASVSIFNKLIFLLPLFLSNSILGYRALGEKRKKEIKYLNFINPFLDIVLSLVIYFLTKSFVYFIVFRLYFLHLINFFSLGGASILFSTKAKKGVSER